MFDVEMDSSYVRHLLMSNYFLAYADLCSYGVKMPRLGATNAKKALIPLPPLKEQKRISNAIESAFAVIDEIERSKADLQTAVTAAKSKILSLAIRGKLVPQDPNDEPASVLLERIRAEREQLFKAGKIKRSKSENSTISPCDSSLYEKLPDGWAYTTLENVVEVLDSFRKPINSAERNARINGKSVSELYPYYGATGKVGYIDDYIFDGDYILLGEDGAPFLDANADKAYIISGKTWVNNHAHILQAKIDLQYLCSVLNAINYKSYVNGTTRLKLTQADMKRITIAVPPLMEQMQIATIVSKSLYTLQQIAESLS